MKYKKKPVVIEAQQWHGFGAAHMNGPVHDAKLILPVYEENRICEHCQNTLSEHASCPTLEGEHIVCPGDYIIKGIAGEFYPCKPEIFKATYTKENGEEI